jgi:hypothetical protein
MCVEGWESKEEGKGEMGEDTGYNLPIVLRPYNGRPRCQHLYVPSNSPPSPPFPLRLSFPPFPSPVPLRIPFIFASILVHIASNFSFLAVY